jgi:2'-5' RNA ligase
MQTDTEMVPDSADHWRWRPDWTAERACTFWYLTIPADAVRLPALEQYVDTLGRTPWLDAVPPRWWHLTLTEIGYADDLGPDLLTEVAHAVQAAVTAQGPLRLELGPVIRFRTAIALSAGPSEELSALQAVVRAETQRVLGDRPVVHPKDFRPHVSLAYVNRAVPGAEVGALLAMAPDVDAPVDVGCLTLAAVTRQDRHYQWHVHDEIALGP